MANFNEHVIVSAAAAGVTYLAMCRYYRRELFFGEGVACIATGAIAGIAPDLLEPAIHPHHRQFCHSATVGALLAGTGATLCTTTSEGWTDAAKILIACTLVGYITHLILDACTPRGLPLLGK